MKYDELPPALKARVDAQLGKAPKRPRRQERGTSTGSCHGCDWTGTYAAWEAHSDAEKHHRFELDLEAA